MKDNSIHLEGSALGSFDGNEVQWYSKFKFGTNIIQMKRKKKVIQTRPLPQSSFGPFELDIQAQDWSEVMEPEDANVKVQNFHRIIRDMLEKHFPEKTVKISNLDKKWFTPELTKENPQKNAKRIL